MVDGADYIGSHVVDLCEAHRLALTRSMQDGGSAVYNLGNGNGFSVAEVIAAAERATDRVIRITPMPRRAGDPQRLVADASLARKELDWQPRFDCLEKIIVHAWAWESKSVTSSSLAEGVV